MIGTWWADLLLSLTLALVLSWLALLVSLAIGRPAGASLKAALRLLPDVLRLIRRLASDSSLPCGVRIRLGLLLAYLAGNCEDPLGAAGGESASGAAARLFP